MQDQVSLGKGLMLCAVVFAAGAVASADDAVPAPWRGSGLYTFQEWEFHTPGGPLPADGDIPLFNPNGVALAAPGPGVAHTLDWMGSGLDGYIGSGGPDSYIDFDVPNYIDFLPVKFIRIQINGDWTAAAGAPTVIDITSFDNVVGPATTFGFDGSGEPFPGFHRFEDWHIIPNPDFEVLRLFIPGDAFVNQVVIETTSIPEPATAALLAIGTLTAMRRRRTGPSRT
jgi:hypothetical protein